MSVTVGMVNRVAEESLAGIQSGVESIEPMRDARPSLQQSKNQHSLRALPARFQIRQELGRGGMGVVYRAFDRTAGHELALKILRGFSSEDRLRLKSEFRALREIVHPNLVDLYELVIEEQICFYTMELLEGIDFARHVAGLTSSCADREQWHARFIDVARQLALALNALHQGEKLHRDVKPSNALVTDASRVVLLDFGLTVSTVGNSFSTEDEFVGTPLYTSPEQRWGHPLTPASDWYSFGVTLYEAVSGKPLSLLDLLGDPAKSLNLRARGFEIREDLEQLIVGLLNHDPARRPHAGQILRCLGAHSETDSARVSILPFRDAPKLIGRDAELDRLDQIFVALGDDFRESTSALRLIGSSGIGKSSLMRVFLNSIARRSDVLVLRSRCHPQEAVAFNAMDGLIDDLSRQVSECLEASERRLPSLEHTALAQVFPVLAKAVIAESDDPVAQMTSDREKRQVAFVALRKILGRISRRRSIVAWLDDVQWGDEDSGMLLRELLRCEECPRMLLVLSYRAEDEGSSPCLRVLRTDDELWRRMAEMRLAPLDSGQSRVLVEHLLGPGWKGDPAKRDELIRAAEGSPFLLNECARYLSTHPLVAGIGNDAASSGLDDILRVRTCGLPSDYRTVLEVLAVAGAPLEQHVTLAAASIDPAQRGLMTNLERLSIVRTTDVASHRVEFYHDRLREEVMRQLTSEVRLKRHLAIARALLDMANPNPLAALDHYEAAGDVGSVRRYVVAAANHALKVLAFDRAARLYQRAIELEPGEVPLYELYRRLGSALGSAGRGRAAATAYAAAARLLKDGRPAATEELVELQQKAAEQFIQTGHFQQGTEMLRAVLSEFGVVLPATREQALKKAAVLRLVALVRGLRAPTRRYQPSDLELRRFDALFAANTRLAMFDYALCSYATVRCAIDAMKLGDRSRMSRALSMEASFSSLLPQRFFQKRARALLELGRDFARDSETAEYDSTFSLGAGAIIDFYQGRFRETWQQADLAIAKLRAQVPGRTWEDGPWQMWSLLGLALNGELRELVRRVRSARDDAALREDRHVELNISLGAPAVAWLVLDVPDEAQRWADQALSWAPPGYTAQHYQHYVTSVDNDLYRDDPFGAWERTLETWPAHQRENFLSLTFIRGDLLRSRARAALAAATALGKSNGARTPSRHSREQLLATAARCARSLAGQRLHSAEGFSELVQAALAQSRGDRAGVLERLRAAVAKFDSGDMRLYREVARYRLGQLENFGDSRAQAEEWMKEQGVLKPARLVAALAPGLD